jgi:hypothetical protein
MVTEGDCSCTDTTEPSNVTSLHSDAASAANLNLVDNSAKVIDKEVDNIEQPRESTHLFSRKRNDKLTISIAYPFLMAIPALSLASISFAMAILKKKFHHRRVLALFLHAYPCDWVLACKIRSA